MASYLLSSNSTESDTPKLGLAERLQTVVKFTSALAESERKLTPAEAMIEARAAETQLYNDYKSIPEYFRQVDDWLNNITTRSAQIDDDLSSSVPANSRVSEEPDAVATRVLAMPGKASTTIGRYVSCAWWREGYSSTIYVTKAPIEPVPAFSGRPGSAVALKAVNPSLLNAPHNAQREIRLMTSIHSPNILALYETFVDRAGHLILVLPFMPLTLVDLITSPGRDVDHSDSKLVLHDMFEGLVYIHEMGIIHRDIKPSNVLLASPKGPAYITDFGIAWSSKDNDENANEKHTDVGTTVYRAPELLFGYRAYGTELDMYAAGVTAAEVMCCLKDHLFEDGGRGTDMALVHSILEKLGTPSEESWPEMNKMPDWGKLQFKDFPSRPWTEILPQAEGNVIDLVEKLVTWSGSKRLSAAETLQHPFFSGIA